MDQIRDNTDWGPVMPKAVSGKNPAPTASQIRSWTLVLSSRKIPFKLIPENNPREIYVPGRFIDIAEKEISLYVEENESAPEKGHPPLTIAGNTLQSLSVLALLGIFHNLTYFQISAFGHASVDWLLLGSADSTKILEGEWWRAITALTLHTDGQHLLGNLLIGGYFVVRLCQQTGSGLGWVLILGSGVAGNLLNAFVHGNGHNAVGASTAIFGAIGVAGAIGTVLARQRLIRYWLLPLAAAAFLLAFLGAGSDGRTDIGAHLFGFVCGCGLGTLAGFAISKKELPGRTVNAALSVAAAATVLWAWLQALAGPGT